mmetsp:Transcript_24470/g.44263  ORF Transcript_24470/g.44263 Transcript_24470/m.44263 type:complete len:85 (+) Transcript_24470:492-746(+)
MSAPESTRIHSAWMKRGDMAVYAVVWYWLFFASLLEILNIQWNSFVPNDLIVFGWRFALDVSPIRDDDILCIGHWINHEYRAMQ